MKKYMVLQQKRYIKMTGVTLWYARQIVWRRGASYSTPVIYRGR